MPALDVSVDGVKIATVSADGLDVLSVSVMGTCVDKELASMQIQGGSYPDNGASKSLTWVLDLPLNAGQRIVVSFPEEGETSCPGKTIEELFPNEPIPATRDVTPKAEMFKELRAKPKVRERMSFRLRSSTGTSFVGTTLPDEHGFGFGVLWDSWNPEFAKISLHAYTLDSLEADGPLNDYVREKIQFGGSVEFELVA